MKTRATLRLLIIPVGSGRQAVKKLSFIKRPEGPLALSRPKVLERHTKNPRKGAPFSVLQGSGARSWSPS